MDKNKISHSVGSVASAIGKGIIAGIAGTAAITLSQMIEMKITGRKPSTAPADAASKVLDVKPATEQDKQQFSQQVHWTYGTSWGIARALIAGTGLEGLPASILHFIAIWGTAITIEPKLGVAPPVTEWEPKTIAVDMLHHAVYAAVAGLVYDAID
jgi:hypothetical protein